MLQIKHVAWLSIIVVLNTIADWQHFKSSSIHSDIENLRSSSSIHSDFENLRAEPRTCSAVVGSESILLSLKPDQFISPITFKLLADAHYGSSPVPEEHLQDLRRLELKY